MNVIYRDGERHRWRENVTTDLFPGIRFYLYIFCATVTNVLVTLLMPVRHPKVPPYETRLTHVTRSDRLRWYWNNVCTLHIVSHEISA